MRESSHSGHDKQKDVVRHKTNVRKRTGSEDCQSYSSWSTPNKISPVTLGTSPSREKSLYLDKSYRVQQGPYKKAPKKRPKKVKKPFDDAEVSDVASHGIIAGNSEVKIIKHNFSKAANVANIAKVEKGSDHRC